ncbi:hypothetical protein AB0M20_06920 [Actinoplanes sp. NPDC051633]|uniref:hypothetical protein n=1 Tax=Actinoplanes sp. NPDC051633 TaxID=3155670 RepID=UPI00342890C1
MRGTKAEPFPPAEIERMRAYPPEIAARMIAAREQGANANQLEATAIELHELLGKDLNEDRRERVMALFRRPESEIRAIDAVYETKYGPPAMARDLNLRLKGLQLVRVTELRFGKTAQADAVAIEDKRRQIEALNKEDAEAAEFAGYGPSVGGYALIMKQKRDEQRRKLTGGITAIVELNKAEALADPANAGRGAGAAVAERLGAIMDQQHGDPGNTLGAELARTLGKEDAAAIRALTDRWNVAGSANLIEAAAAQLAADEKAGKVKASTIVEQLRSFRELARRDLKIDAPNLPPDRQQELLADPEAAASRLGQQYIERYKQAYDRLRDGGRSFDRIVTSADDADELLIDDLVANGEASEVTELRHAVAKKDVAKVKDILRGQKDGAAIEALVKRYNASGEGRDLKRELFGRTGDGSTADAKQAQSSEFMAAFGGLVRARDAAQVGELLDKPADFTSGAQAEWLSKGGINEYDVTMAHRGLTGDVRAWGDDPETQQLLKRTRDDLEKMNQRFAATTDPGERERLLREMRRLRATLTGDADAYEADNARVLAEIQGALSFAVSLALAFAIPGAGAGLAAFLQTAALNIAATVASNFVIKMGDYGWDDLKADVLGGALGAGGAKFGEELMGRVAAAVMKPAAKATAGAAAKSGVTTVLSREVAAMTGAGEKIVIEAAEFEVKAAAGAAAKTWLEVGAREVGGFAGGLYAPKVLTGDYGLTMEEVLKALAGTLAGKAGGKYRDRAAAKKKAAESTPEAPTHEDTAEQRPDEDGALPQDGVPAPAAFHPEPAPANADVFGPRSPKQMLLDNGIPPASAEGFQQVADVLNVVIKVRPTNTASLDVLAGGGVAKPELIKAKTVNRVDLMIGGPHDGLGKVGFFEPTMPTKDVLDVLLPAERAAIDARHAERSAEFKKYSEEYAGLAKDGILRMEGGVLKIVDPLTGDFNEIGGDHDLFEITGPDGQPLNDHVRRGVINQLRSMGINVEHGDHTSWKKDSPDSHDPKADSGIRQKHETSEPLVAFLPKSQPREVMAGDAVAGPARTEGPGDRHLPAEDGRVVDPANERGESPMMGRSRPAPRGTKTDPQSDRIAARMLEVLHNDWPSASPDQRADLLIGAVIAEFPESGLLRPSGRAVDGDTSQFLAGRWQIDIGHLALFTDYPTIADFAAATEHARHEVEHALIEFRIIRLELTRTGIKPAKLAAKWAVHKDAVHGAVKANASGAEPLGKLTEAGRKTEELHELIRGRTKAADYRATVEGATAAVEAIAAAEAAHKQQPTPETQRALDDAESAGRDIMTRYENLADEVQANRVGKQLQESILRLHDPTARLEAARKVLEQQADWLRQAIDTGLAQEIRDSLTEAVAASNRFIAQATEILNGGGPDPED